MAVFRSGSGRASKAITSNGFRWAPLLDVFVGESKSEYGSMGKFDIRSLSSESAVDKI